MQADVVIVGGGPTAAHAAALMAKAALSVILIDKMPKGKTGARWVNGVPRWMLHEAGAGDPAQGEIFAQDVPFSLRPHGANTNIRIAKFPVLDMDMRLFGERLLDDFCKLPSATALFSTELVDVRCDNSGRPREIVAEHDGQTTSIRAALFVDCSGVAAALCERVPTLAHYNPPFERHELCATAQFVYEIADRKGARAFLTAHDAQPGEMLAFTGFAGNYSLLRVHIAEDFSHIAFLAAAVASKEHPGGIRIIRDFLAQHAFVGRKLFGGSRALPLRRPRSAIASAGIALLGDAASQIYTPHGSGIGAGLIAARILATTVIDAAMRNEDIGSIKAIWPYAVSFHKKMGALLSTADAMRIWLQSLTPRETAALADSGLLTESMVFDSLLQKNPQINIADLEQQIRAALSNLGLAQKLLFGLARLPVIYLWGLRYPQNESLASALSYDLVLGRLSNASGDSRLATHA